jgi:hypothetical protein
MVDSSWTSSGMMTGRMTWSFGRGRPGFVAELFHDVEEFSAYIVFTQAEISEGIVVATLELFSVFQLFCHKFFMLRAQR